MPNLPLFASRARSRTSFWFRFLFPAGFVVDAWTAGNTRPAGTCLPACPSVHATAELPVRFRFQFPSAAAAAIDHARTCVAAIDNACTRPGIGRRVARRHETVWSRHGTLHALHAAASTRLTDPVVVYGSSVEYGPTQSRVRLYTRRPTRLHVYPHVWYMLVGRSPPQMARGKKIVFAAWAD